MDAIFGSCQGNGMLVLFVVRGEVMILRLRTNPFRNGSVFVVLSGQLSCQRMTNKVELGRKEIKFEKN